MSVLNQPDFFRQPVFGFYYRLVSAIPTGEPCRVLHSRGDQFIHLPSLPPRFLGKPRSQVTWRFA